VATVESSGWVVRSVMERSVGVEMEMVMDSQHTQKK